MIYDTKRFYAQERSKSNISGRLRKIFLENGYVSDSELAKLGLSHTDMAIRTYSLLRPVNPDNWLWVRFNEHKAVWELAGTGGTIPDDWDGYLPPALRGGNTA